MLPSRIVREYVFDTRFMAVQYYVLLKLPPDTRDSRAKTTSIKYRLMAESSRVKWINRIGWFYSFWLISYNCKTDITDGYSCTGYCWWMTKSLC